MGTPVAPNTPRWREGWAEAPARRALLQSGVVAAAVAAGCALPGGRAPEAAGPHDAPVGVTLLARSAEMEAFTRRAARFQERYPRIRLEPAYLPGNYPEVIRANAAAGTLADAI